MYRVSQIYVYFLTTSVYNVPTRICLISDDTVLRDIFVVTSVCVFLNCRLKTHICWHLKDNYVINYSSWYI